MSFGSFGEELSGCLIVNEDNNSNCDMCSTGFYMDSRLRCLKVDDGNGNGNVSFDGLRGSLGMMLMIFVWLF